MPGGEGTHDEGKRWLVLRTDDAGSVFLVRDGLNEASARALVATFTARGHKQTYYAFSYADASDKAELCARLNVRI